MSHSSEGKGSKENTIPEFTESQYEYLRRVFPAVSIQPETPHSQIMYSAGEQNVLELVKRRVAGWSKVRIGPELS